MLAFYQRLFPFRHLFQWLNHSPKPSADFANREFAFTLSNDAYLRYQSFPTADLLRKDILRLNPSRFEIGPVYSTNPRDRKTLRRASTFRPISKELVFDIDLTDYDSIRTCCDKANICLKCWPFVTMAIKVVDSCLRTDFGFSHILWVYSGRRGCHAWISDKKAREMSDVVRKALAGYLEVIRGGEKSGKKVNVKRPLHPHLQRSLDLLAPHFQHDILSVQNPFASSDGSETLLSLLPDSTLIASLRKKWDSSPGRSSTQKWADIDTVAKAGGAGRDMDPKALLWAKQDIILEYTYPRLDVEVSKKMIHLLKSPFVVHPGTGRVCVPLPIRKVGEGQWEGLEEFDPLGVPTVTELLGEIDSWTAEGREEEGLGDADKKVVADWEKTRLGPYVEYFRGHVARLIKEEGKIGVKREREEGEGMEF
jgi:DNA primase small subunit